MNKELPLAQKIKKILLPLLLLAFLTACLFHGINDPTVQSGSLVIVAPAWAGLSVFSLYMVTSRRSWVIGILSVIWWFLTLAVFVVVCHVIAGKLEQLPAWGNLTTWIVLCIGGVMAFLFCLKDQDKDKLFKDLTSKPGDRQ